MAVGLGNPINPIDPIQRPDVRLKRAKTSGQQLDPDGQPQRPGTIVTIVTSWTDIQHRTSAGRLNS